MYDSYENLSGDVPIINVDDILCETIKNVNNEHIGAFYRPAYRKFVTVLKEVELDLYSHEINFKGKVGGTEHIYGILPLPPRGGNELRRKNFTNAVFVTMFFPKVVSDTGFEKAFLEFGEVHDLTANLKSHIRISVMAKVILELLPIKPSMTFPKKYSLMTLSFFKSCGLRRKYHAKSVFVHML